MGLKGFGGDGKWGVYCDSGSKSIVFDHGDKLRWYLLGSWGLGGFLKSEIKSINKGDWLVKKEVLSDFLWEGLIFVKVMIGAFRDIGGGFL